MLAGLPADDAQVLHDRIEALVVAQRAALAAAVDAALAQVPWALRGVVRKVLFP